MDTASRISAYCTNLRKSLTYWLVHPGDHGVANSLHLLLLLLELVHLGELVGIKPLDDLITLGVDCLPHRVGGLLLHPVVVNGRLHVEAVALQVVLGPVSCD